MQIKQKGIIEFFKQGNIINSIEKLLKLGVKMIGKNEFKSML